MGGWQVLKIVCMSLDLTNLVVKSLPILFYRDEFAKSLYLAH